MLQTRWWGAQMPSVAIWTVGISLLLGLVALKLRSATPGAAAAGAVITASLMFSTVRFPYLPWQTALTPVVALLVLTSITTRIGKNRKDKLGTGEGRRGRAASQVAANLGVAAIVSSDLVQSWIVNSHWFSRGTLTPIPVLIPALAALAEAAADTVSSELGQVLSSQPRMITTLRRADAGTDGAISVGGTLVGIVAAGIVAFVGSVVLRGSAEMLPMLAISWSGGVFGLLFDSLLGATLERRGWINNDAVNFLSTASSAILALALLAIIPHPAVG
jgi:uncharacterized protein (TIGR00297 family)